MSSLVYIYIDEALFTSFVDIFQAHALNPTEIQRALVQCKEQNQSILEKACLAVENAAKDGGVYPEVLFMVARQWYMLYTESVGNEATNDNNHHNVNLQFAAAAVAGGINENHANINAAAHVQPSMPMCNMAASNGHHNITMLPFPHGLGPPLIPANVAPPNLGLISAGIDF